MATIIGKLWQVKNIKLPEEANYFEVLPISFG